MGYAIPSNYVCILYATICLLDSLIDLILHIIPGLPLYQNCSPLSSPFLVVFVAFCFFISTIFFGVILDILYAPEGDKYKVAQKWGSIHTVSRKWFEQSIARKGET